MSCDHVYLLNGADRGPKPGPITSAHPTSDHVPIFEKFSVVASARWYMTPSPGFKRKQPHQNQIVREMGRSDSQIRVNGHWVRNWEMAT